MGNKSYSALKWLKIVFPMNISFKKGDYLICITEIGFQLTSFSYQRQQHLNEHCDTGTSPNLPRVRFFWAFIVRICLQVKWCMILPTTKKFRWYSGFRGLLGTIAISVCTI